MAERNKEPEKNPENNSKRGAELSQLLLERYALDELPQKTRAEVERRLAEDPAAQARLDEIRRTNSEILAAYPPETVVPNIERRARRDAAERQTAPRKNFLLLVPITSALAVAALLVLMLRPPVPGPDVNSNGGLEPTRLKGQKPLLLIFEKPAAGAQPRPLADGATVKAHALLQMAYVAAGKPHGVVVSIDGRGETTLHHPSSPQSASKLEPGQVFLPSSYELDDAPHYERFFFVTAANPIDISTVMAAAKALAADKAQARTAKLVLPAGYDQTSLVLNKPGQGAGP